MNILAIDSSNKQAKLSLFCDNAFYNHLMDETKSHSEFLLKEIEDFLSFHDLTIRQIDYLSVNIGPGSFTGIRIGISFVKAFMCALNQKTVTVNNFELIDYNIKNKESSYYIVLCSNNEDFYTLKIENKKLNFGFMNAETLNEIISKTNEKVYCLESEKDKFLNLLNLNPVSIYENSFIEISKNKIENDEFCGINQISPLYIKKSQAEMGLYKQVEENLFINDFVKLDDLVILEQKCFDEPYSKSLLKNDVENKNRHQFFAYFKDELIGYICFEEIMEELNLFKICVLPEFREYGVGTKLMQKMIDYFAGKENLKSIFLEVDLKNVYAIKLYEKFGFKKLSVRKNYYQNGNDAVIYQLKK